MLKSEWKGIEKHIFWNKAVRTVPFAHFYLPAHMQMHKIAKPADLAWTFQKADFLIIRSTES